MERGGQEGTRKNNGRLLYSDLIYIYIIMKTQLNINAINNKKSFPKKSLNERATHVRLGI